ncbi:MAG: DUF6544 family protein [Mycobacteriaceae bacterium]
MTKISMTTTLRWLIVAVLTGHGLIHLLGAAKGFGLADVSQLTKPIGVSGGALWLLAAVLVLAAAVFLAVGAPTWWWAIALAAAAVSQIAIATSWNDARVGTIVNLILVLAAGYGFAAEGATSFHAQYREHAAQAHTDVDHFPAVLDESDLVDLPIPLAAYIRRSGAVGHPRLVSFHADFHGRIRSGPDAAWMPFTGQQFNTYGPRPQRIFLMDAVKSGLPVTVLHVFADTTATMRVKLLSLFTLVDASGPEMDRGETVTVFNDLVVMAPGAIVDARATWTAIDPLHVRGEFTDGEQTISAVLTFDAEHDLVDFVSDDRTAASPDGRTFTPRRWSTPLAGHRDADGRRILTSGEGVWHAGGPEGSFAYLEFSLDAISYNGGSDETTTTLSPPASTALAVSQRNRT